jgi:multicomponent Na+:H+ antiporter subunit F
MMSSPDPVLMLVSGILILALLLVLVRALRGPSVFDRILAVNVAGTKTVILVALLGFVSARPEFLDIALLYALMNFVVTIAILKVRQFGQLG